MKKVYEQYARVLNEELVAALGCTEPIAIAYAGALARRLLGQMPERMLVEASGNIIKNVKGVVVPNSGGQKGMAIAAILGALGGDPDKKLEVLSTVTPADIEKGRQLDASGMCKVGLMEGVSNLHIILTVEGGGHKAIAEIAGGHTNVVRLEKDGKIVQGGDYKADTSDTDNSRDFMSVEGIVDFAEHCDLEPLKPLLDRQIEFNTKIAEEGLAHKYGVNAGKSLLDKIGHDVRTSARAYAAAGSDARMSGCDLPVVINSGSGNQGITVSMPVVIYAKELGAPREKLYRALLISNLVAIHQKSGIGKLSAYCGAVSAACGGGVGIAWMQGANLAQMKDTITNTLGTISGMVCDGAKPSCATKIASAVEAALLGRDLAMQGRAFAPGEGIVKDNIEKTIDSVGRMARKGMKSTDVEILNIMIEDEKVG
jgi:L-cysteine desulfidase